MTSGTHNPPREALASFNFFSFLPVTMVIMLRPINFLAIARPRPDVPPVTMAIFSERRLLMLTLFLNPGVLVDHVRSPLRSRQQAVCLLIIVKFFQCRIPIH